MYDKYAKQYYDFLHDQKESIEIELGYDLEWQRLEERKGSRIVKYREGLIDNEDERQELIKWLYGKFVEFHRVFYTRIQTLQVQNLQPDGDGVMNG